MIEIILEQIEKLNYFIREETDSVYESEGGSSGPWSGIDLNGDSPWLIGCGMASGVRNDYFNGIIDEVKISCKPLAPTDFLTSAIPEPLLFTIYPLLLIIYWRKFK